MPERPIRWGIVGTGRIAALFAESLASAGGATLHAVASRHREAGQRFATDFGARRLHDSCENLADDPDVDVVYIATPTACHREHCLAVLSRGKSVLCEKPLATTAGEAREIVAAARQAGVFCMEGMWMRCSPAVRSLKARMPGVGAPRLFEARLGFSRIVDPGSRVFAIHGGGALLDLAVYPLALAQYLLGTPTVTAAHALFTASGVDEQVSVILAYPSGCQGLISASLRSQLTNDATLAGVDGRLHLDEPLYFPERVTFHPAGPAADPGRIRPSLVRRAAMQRWLQPARRLARAARHRLSTHAIGHPGFRGTGLTVEAEEVGRCVRSGLKESPLVPLADSVAVLETIDAIRGVWRRP